MKLVSSVAVALALVAGGLALSVTPALAAKEKPKKEKAGKETKAPPAKLSKEFTAAYQKVDASLKANNLPEAQSGIAAAAAVATTPDDKFFLGQLKLTVAQKNNDRALLRAALVEMLAAQSPQMTNGGQLALNAGMLAYEQKDYADAIARVNQAEQMGATSPDGFIFAADASFRQKQVPGGLALAKKAIAAAAAAGKPADLSWYARPRSAAYQAGLVAEGGEWSRMIAKAFPTRDNFHDAVAYHLNATKPADEARADLFRGMIAMNAMISRDEYRELADLLVRLQAPGEAQAVLDDGMNKKIIQASDAQISTITSTIAPLLKTDRASLAAGERSARSADRGSITARWAGAFFGYGEYAKSAELYRLALQKGQVNADQINYRLGLALARQGNKAEALAALNAAQGSYADLAKIVALYLETGVTPAA